MSGTLIGLSGFAGLLALLFFRVQIAVAMLLAGAAIYVAASGWTWNGLLFTLNDLVYARLSNYDLAVVPLFILMGQFATHGGLSRSLFQAAGKLIGHWRGGMAMAAVAACASFGAICGSSLATAATMGQVALPELRSHGYSGRLATSTLAASGTLGIMIPPSVPLIIYAVLELRTWIDGRLCDTRRLKDLLRAPAQLLADVSEFMTLRRGDVLLTGVVYQSPVAQAGASVRIEALGSGSLDFTLATEEQPA